MSELFSKKRMKLSDCRRKQDNLRRAIKTAVSKRIADEMQEEINELRELEKTLTDEESI